MKALSPGLLIQLQIDHSRNELQGPEVGKAVQQGTRDPPSGELLHRYLWDLLPLKSWLERGMS